MISVVIPTCNRPNDLILVLNSLKEQETNIHEIIVVDSSDYEIDLSNYSFENTEFKHIKVDLKSAAIQRNVGMDHVSEDCSYLCFLDDDVNPESNYLSNLVKGIKINKGVGISGIAINPAKTGQLRMPPKGAFGMIQRFFLLDSTKDGTLLKSGVNIPIRRYSGPITKVDWLIGCSLWDFNKVKSLRFEKDFMGVSLNEDVIFSVRASVRGDLFVDPNTHLWHSESEVGRQVGSKFWQMWVLNRKRLVQVSAKNKPIYFYFHLANFGQFISLLYSGLRNKNFKEFAFLGIVVGYWRLLFPRIKNED
jgi:GT2 family glycosyltransferase